MKNWKFIGWFLLLLFLTSTDTILFGTNANRTMLLVPRILGAISCVLLPIYCGRRDDNSRIGTICIVMILIMFVSSIINEDEMVTTISKIISVFTGFVIAKHIPYTLFAKQLEKFLYFVSCIAIVVEIVSYVYPSLIMMMPTIENAAGTEYKTFFFGSLPVGFLSESLIRANAVFWEAGAFASYLIWILLIDLFYNENYNFKYVAVFLVSLLLTFSTTGYLTFVVVAVAYLINKKESDANYAKMRKRFKYSFIGLLLILVISNGDAVYDLVFGKLGEGDEMSSSAQTRFSSLFNGFNAFLLNPIFGGGSNTEELMIQAMSLVGAKYGGGGAMLTNTFIANFVCFGIIFGSIFLVGSIKYAKRFSQKKIVRLLLVAAFLMAYSGERFFSFMPFVFMFYGFIPNYQKNENSFN